MNKIKLSGRFVILDEYVHRNEDIRDYLFNAIDEVDAWVFSWDVLYNDREREFIKEHCHRWLRAIDSHESNEEK